MPASERHDLDALSLVFGLLFTVLAAAFLLAPPGLFVGLELRWVLPVAALIAGVVLLASALRGHERDREGAAHAQEPGELEADEEGARRTGPET